MLRYAAYALFFLFLTLGGMIGLEFNVGLLLYHPITATPPELIMEVRPMVGCPKTPWLLYIKSKKEGAAEQTIEIPLPQRQLSLVFHGITWHGAAQSVGFKDRVKLAWLRLENSPPIPVNGGTDSCWKLVKNAGAMTMDMGKAYEWTIPIEFPITTTAIRFQLMRSGPQIVD